MRKQHPFADRWNHNTMHYPLIADALVGHRGIDHHQVLPRAEAFQEVLHQPDLFR